FDAESTISASLAMAATLSRAVSPAGGHRQRAVERQQRDLAAGVAKHARPQHDVIARERRANLPAGPDVSAVVAVPAVAGAVVHRVPVKLAVVDVGDPVPVEAELCRR